MGSKRKLKKHINDACADAVDECFTYQQYNPGKKTEETQAIIEEAVAVRNDLVERINQIRKIKAENLAEHMNQLLDDFDDHNLKMIERLNQLAN
jgi:hypothetical protein